MKKFVVYYREFKVRHGEPSLGLEGQQESINQFLNAIPEAVVTAEYVETESNRKGSRPKLTAALAEAKATEATLLIAKLEGLGRDASFLQRLVDGNVDLVCCDHPHVNTSTVGALAAMAAYDAKRISTRTKDALAAKKARGEVIVPPDSLNAEARAKSLEVRKHNAKVAVEPVSDIIADKRRMDWTYQQISDYLNETKHTTPRGYQWTPIAVRRVFIIDSILSEMQSDTETN